MYLKWNGTKQQEKEEPQYWWVWVYQVILIIQEQQISAAAEFEQLPTVLQEQQKNAMNIAAC